MYYVEEIQGELIDREAEVLDKAERCELCHEPADGHDRRARAHTYTPEAGLSLRVTFPANRRPRGPGKEMPEEIVDYSFVAPGMGPNQYHD